MSKNNNFQLFDNKTSLAKRQSRMLNGGETEIKGDKLGWWERESFDKNIESDIRITIPEVYDRRPDLLSYRIYQTPRLFWLILQYNSIVDVEEEFRTGQEIILPSPVRALTSMVNNSIISEVIE